MRPIFSYNKEDSAKSLSIYINGELMSNRICTSSILFPKEMVLTYLTNNV